jgi:hypothetical protein
MYAFSGGTGTNEKPKARECMAVFNERRCIRCFFTLQTAAFSTAKDLLPPCKMRSFTFRFAAYYPTESRTTLHTQAFLQHKTLV